MFHAHHTYKLALIMIATALFTTRSMIGGMPSSDADKTPIAVFACVTAATYAGLSRYNSCEKVIENLYKKREAKIATNNDELMIKIYESNNNIVKAAVHTYNGLISMLAGMVGVGVYVYCTELS